MPITLSALAERLNLPFEGPAELILARVCSLEEPQSDGLGFAEAKSLSLGASSGSPNLPKLAAVICLPEAEVCLPCIRSPKPRYHYAQAAALLHPAPVFSPGQHSSALVDSTSAIDPSAHVGPYCVVGPNCRIEAGAVLQGLVHVGGGSVVESGARLLPGVVVGQNCRIGEGALIDARAKVLDGSQVGAYSYIGAGSVIDGAQLGRNVIVDNLASVASGAKVGGGSILISKSYIGRGAQLGIYNLIAAVSLVSDMVQLANFIQVAGYSVVTENCDTPKTQLGGDPARSLKDEVRERALAARALKIYQDYRRR